MPDRSRKRPRDSNQLAKLITDIANPYPPTPAMAAGIADHIWTMTEIAELLD